MRQLFPDFVDPADLLDVYGDLPVVADRPFVRLDMIASVDGATAVAGLSGALGGAGDHAVFAVLRSLADFVLVAAGTVRAERYGPSEVPIAVVTRSCRLDWDAPFFTAATIRPVVLTVADAPSGNVARTAEVADVVVAGRSDVDLGRSLAALAERGARSVVAEGGPSLNGQLVAAGLLDELCPTVAPRLVSGDSKRIAIGPPLATPLDMELRSVCEEDGSLFLRHRSSRMAHRRSTSAERDDDG